MVVRNWEVSNSVKGPNEHFVQGSEVKQARSILKGVPTAGGIQSSYNAAPDKNDWAQQQAQ